MTRDETIARLKAHEAELRAAGIVSLTLFGSTARDEAGEASDIDLMCEIDDARVHDLLQFVGLELKLRDIVGRDVDLVERGYMRPRIAQRAALDQVAVF